MESNLKRSCLYREENLPVVSPIKPNPLLFCRVGAASHDLSIGCLLLYHPRFNPRFSSLFHVLARIYLTDPCSTGKDFSTVISSTRQIDTAYLDNFMVEATRWINFYLVPSHAVLVFYYPQPGIRSFFYKLFGKSSFIGREIGKRFERTTMEMVFFPPSL